MLKATKPFPPKSRSYRDYNNGENWPSGGTLAFMFFFYLRSKQKITLKN